MFCVLNLKKILSMLLVSVGGLLITISFLKNDNNYLEVFSHSENLIYTIIVDAGHGEPDGGAVSKSGVAEARTKLRNCFNA